MFRYVHMFVSVDSYGSKCVLRFVGCFGEFELETPWEVFLMDITGDLFACVLVV